MQQPIQTISQYLPTALRHPIEKAATASLIPIHEIRLRIGHSPSVTSCGQNLFITRQGELTTSPATDLIVTKALLHETFMKACRHSVYAYDKELQNGFITLPGGFRMGIAGRIIYENQNISTVRDISSVSIRIAAEQKGCCHELLPHLVKNGQMRSCAVISPPGGGKTTFLRDIARCLSIRGYRVCIIDERREIAACQDGIASFELGALCDTLDGCDKLDGMMWALRCLSPSVMIMDELGCDEEAKVVLQGINGGVASIFSLHAANLKQALRRSPMRLLLKNQTPELLVFLDNAYHPGRILKIYDLLQEEDLNLVQSLWCSSA